MAPATVMAGPKGTPLEAAGVRVVADFVTPEEETALAAALDARPWEPLRRRRVQHYGRRFVYGGNSVDPAEAPQPMPDFLQPLLRRLVDCVVVEAEPDQVTVNEYLPGQGIGPHVDAYDVFEEPLLSLSLLSLTTMEFRPQGSNERIACVLLPRRSLLVLTGEARFQWRHSIAERTTDTLPSGDVIRRVRRLSLTFRKVRAPPTGMLG